LLDDLLNIEPQDALSSSIKVKLIVVDGEFILTKTSSGIVMIGASFTGATVNINVVLELSFLVSDTVNVILDEPKAFASGVRLKKQLGVVPEKIIPPAEMTLVSLVVELSELVQSRPVLIFEIEIEIPVNGVSSLVF
jgi:hypothetical protein